MPAPSTPSSPATERAEPRPRVCVVGSLNMDLVIRTPRLPQPGETVMGGEASLSPGGKGANQAVAAARMGADVTLIACAGDDEPGTRLRAALQGEGLDLTHLKVRAGTPSGIAVITVSETGENTIVVSPGANATLTPDDVRVAGRVVARADVLLLQLETSAETAVTAAEIAKAAGKPVILNAAPARKLPVELLRLVDVVVVNRTEASILVGMEGTADPARLALRLPELGPATALLTLGAQGAILCHRGRPRRVPALPVHAVDSVGAGDAFIGALATRWPAAHAARAHPAEEFPLVERAVLTAAVAGALAATKPGAIPSLPRESDVLPLVPKLTMSLAK